MINNSFKLYIYIYKTMLSYCLKCSKNTESGNSNVVGTKNGKIMLLSRCAVCNGKKSYFLRNKNLEDY